jgi:glycosyltransferase involved in cell wall biosynthesis
MSLKVSLITATFNNAKVLERAIQSALNQSYSNIEYIVIDGGSTDETHVILEKYRIQISKIISEKDNGIYDALNKGIRAATGDIIGFLHSDDQFYSKQSIEHIVAKLEPENVDGLYSDLQYIQNKPEGLSVVRYWKSKTFHPNLLAHGWMPAHPTLFLKKKVYDREGHYSLNYRILKIFKSGKYRFDYLPEITVSMQVGGESNKSLKKILQKSREDYEILAAHGYSPALTLLGKNLSKIGQFIFKKRTNGKA